MAPILIPLLLTLALFHPLNALPIPPPPATATSFEESLIRQACLETADSNDCMGRIRADRRPNHGPVPILHAAVRGAINSALGSIDTFSGMSSLSDSLREQTAVEDCSELLSRTVDELSWSLAEMSADTLEHASSSRSWLSAALGNQDTCLEGFHGTDGRLKGYVHSQLYRVSVLITNLLEMYKMMHGIMPMPPITNNDTWIEDEEVVRGMKVDAVVATDGSGRFRTINEAVNNAPNWSGKRWVIFVKRGVYKENVELKKKKSNIMMVGEGIGKTVITGSRNFMQGWTTFRTATFGKIYI